MLTELIDLLNTDFKDILKNEYLPELEEKLEAEYEKFEGCIDIYPPQNLIFNAFNQFNINDCRVLILGQDPYINKGEAMGLCFSVPNECPMPPSLRNIFKELELEYGTLRTNKDLSDWTKQGVLMMNASLTVLAGKSNYHAKLWKNYTDKVISDLSKRNPNIIYVLWGRFAQDKEKLIDKGTVIKGVHPSPLSASRGFFGCNHFKQVNEKLETPIEWF